MTINTLSTSLSGDEDLRAIDGWVAAANAAGVPYQEYVDAFVRERGRELAGIYKIGGMASSEFLLRFTPAEIESIVEAAQADQVIAAILVDVKREPNVSLDDSRVKPSLDYLVSLGLLEPGRIPELLSYTRPTPRDFSVEPQTLSELPISPGLRRRQELGLA